jgi:hypothetical protein
VHGKLNALPGIALVNRFNTKEALSDDTAKITWEGQYKKDAPS